MPAVSGHASAKPDTKSPATAHESHASHGGPGGPGGAGGVRGGNVSSGPKGPSSPGGKPSGSTGRTTSTSAEDRNRTDRAPSQRSAQVGVQRQGGAPQTGPAGPTRNGNITSVVSSPKHNPDFSHANPSGPQTSAELGRQLKAQVAANPNYKGPVSNLASKTNPRVNFPGTYSGTLKPTEIQRRAAQVGLSPIESYSQNMSPATLSKLTDLSEKLGQSISLTSGFSPTGHVGKSQHHGGVKPGTPGSDVGNAFDAQVEGGPAARAAFAQAAREVGFRGVGTYEGGDAFARDMVHVDTGPTRSWGAVANAAVRGQAPGEVAAHPVTGHQVNVASISPSFSPSRTSSTSSLMSPPSVQAKTAPQGFLPAPSAPKKQAAPVPQPKPQSIINAGVQRANNIAALNIARNPFDTRGVPTPPMAGDIGIPAGINLSNLGRSRVPARVSVSGKGQMTDVNGVPTAPARTTKTQDRLYSGVPAHFNPPSASAIKAPVSTSPVSRKDQARLAQEITSKPRSRSPAPPAKSTAQVARNPISGMAFTPSLPGKMPSAARSRSPALKAPIGGMSFTPGLPGKMPGPQRSRSPAPSVTKDVVSPMAGQGVISKKVASDFTKLGISQVQQAKIAEQTKINNQIAGVTGKQMKAVAAIPGVAAFLSAMKDYAKRPGTVEWANKHPGLINAMGYKTPAQMAREAISSLMAAGQRAIPGALMAALSVASGAMPRTAQVQVARNEPVEAPPTSNSIITDRIPSEFMPKPGRLVRGVVNLVTKARSPTPVAPVQVTTNTPAPVPAPAPATVQPTTPFRSAVVGSGGTDRVRVANLPPVQQAQVAANPFMPFVFPTGPSYPADLGGPA